MARVSLLDLTQRILSPMDSDNVNSITETVESEQVAEIIRETYLDIVDEFDLENEKTLFELDASGTTDRPTHMTIPEGIHSIEWVRYDNRNSVTDTRINFVPIKFLEAEDFVAKTNSRNSDDSTIDTVEDPSGVRLLIRNDANPEAYTTFDGKVLVFDNYDSAIENTLQTSKTQAYGQESNDLVIEDETVIDLPQELYMLLRHQAKETAFELLKDGAPQKVKQMANRARIRAGRLRTKLRIDREARTGTGPNYGRR